MDLLLSMKWLGPNVADGPVHGRHRMFDQSKIYSSVDDIVRRPAGYTLFNDFWAFDVS